jgi:hypothetical protein
MSIAFGLELQSGLLDQLMRRVEVRYPPITYYCTVPLILDISYIVVKLTILKIADTKVSGF